MVCVNIFTDATAVSIIEAYTTGLPARGRMSEPARPAPTRPRQTTGKKHFTPETNPTRTWTHIVVPEIPDLEAAIVCDDEVGPVVLAHAVVHGAWHGGEPMNDMMAHGATFEAGPQHGFPGVRGRWRATGDL